MREASVERLARLISENNSDSQDEEQHRHEFHLSLAEGWFSLFLVATVCFSTVLCVQAANWVEHLDALTFITTVGLAYGIVAAKQQLFPKWSMHLIALCLGLLLALWQTSSAFFGNDIPLFLTAMQRWIAVVNSGGATDDDSIFLFFIITLSFMLSYASIWFVYRTRNPWLMILANAMVILINLNNAQDKNILYLIVFLLASLLLLLRFNLYESVVRWRRQGLRFSDDLSWDFMQTGALISVGLLIFSWILPGSYVDPVVSRIWNTNGSPLVVVQNTWNRMFSVSNNSIPANHGSFQKDLVLGGNPHLTNDVVMIVQSDDGSQYLGSLAYDTYTGRGWTNAGTVDDTLKVPTDFSYSSGALDTHPVKQKISVVNAPQGSYPFVFGASEIAQVNIPTKWLSSSTTGALVAWVGQDARIATGNTSYTVISDVSSADIATLRSVPMPRNAPDYPDSSGYNGVEIIAPPTAYNPLILRTNIALPKDMNPRIAKLAQSITANAPTMYDKVVALETYLRQHYTYSLDVQLPAGREGVSWFLFDSKKGYCNYFASAMAVMARSLGIPARVEVGYTNGSLDARNHQRIVRGVDAHAWTQVYFAGYGWINFEPSATFPTFTRPLPNQYSKSITSTPADLTGSLAKQLPAQLRDKDPESAFDTSANATAARNQQWQREMSVGLGGIIVLLIVAAIAFGVWWRRLFRGYSESMRIFGKIYLLANWAGIGGQTSQTPYEYIKGLFVVAPGDEKSLERLSDIYVRERWADPQSLEHPVKTGEIQELPGIWRKLQPKFILYVLRHPRFLRWLPKRVARIVVAKKKQWHLKRRWKAEDL
ncbi:MAG TPA: transglutaminase-like domain-containing protein [Ktedonobacteraceae bacterium]|jgi:transglutaminase-like putative cysteine protease|nr:transglutaminase-like domain-containing protein [Ktedonobacteraceae bacterium]